MTFYRVAMILFDFRVCFVVFMIVMYFFFKSSRICSNHDVFADALVSIIVEIIQTEQTNKQDTQISE